jgi:formate dehydrogenase subunit beta
MILDDLVQKALDGKYLVFSPIEDGKSLALISNSDEVKITPIPASFNYSAAKAFSKVTRLGPLENKTVLVLKPCEERALRELVKLKQASLENVVTLGYDCLGFEKEGEMRSACSACSHPFPLATDITFVRVGGEGLKANTARGGDLLEELGFSSDVEVDEKAKEGFLAEKLKKGGEMAAEFNEISGYENLLNFLAECINCHNCMALCPVCYCQECFFDSKAFDYEPYRYERAVRKRGALEIPRDKFLFHLGRLAHMSTLCVACGLCEDGCPKEIELTKLFKVVSERVQEKFGYLPGSDQELPLSTYREDEFTDLG